MIVNYFRNRVSSLTDIIFGLFFHIYGSIFRRKVFKFRVQLAFSFTSETYRLLSSFAHSKKFFYLHDRSPSLQIILLNKRKPKSNGT